MLLPWGSHRVRAGFRLSWGRAVAFFPVALSFCGLCWRGDKLGPDPPPAPAEHPVPTLGAPTAEHRVPSAEALGPDVGWLEPLAPQPGSNPCSVPAGFPSAARASHRNEGRNRSSSVAFKAVFQKWLKFPEEFWSYESSTNL